MGVTFRNKLIFVGKNFERYLREKRRKVI